MKFNEKIQQHIQQIITATSDELKAARGRQLEAIPRYKLTSRHTDGGQIVANRSELVKKLPANAVVAELGADQGEFSSVILNSANPKKLHIIDSWHTERYSDAKAIGVSQLFHKQIETGQVAITRALSVTAAEQFDDNYFDWIYIDTDHSYETTIAELFAYERTVKAGGFICGHDYVLENWLTGYKYGVVEAVAEFCVSRNWRLMYLTADFTENNSFAICRL